MLETEFGGSVWLPYALLGLSLAVGFAILLYVKGRRKGDSLEERVPRRRPRTVEEELAAELEAARARRGAEDGAPPEEPAEDGVLEPPAAERERMERIRQLDKKGTE